MSVRVRVDTIRFQKDFRDRVARTKKTLPQITNTVAYFVAKEAMNDTKRADKMEIEKLGVIAYQVLKKSKMVDGKMTGRGFLKKFKAQYDQNGAIRAIFVALMRKRGRDPRSFGAGEIGKAAVRMLARRMSAIGFLASGWIPALKKLSAINGYGSFIASDARQRGKPQGGIKLAVEGWSPRCEFWNSTLAHKTAQEPASQERMAGQLERALQSSFDKNADNMERETVKRLNQVWR